MRVINNSISCLRITLLILLVLAANSASYADSDDAFKVKRAKFTQNDSMFYMDLIVQTTLPDYIAIAVDQGFAVPIMFEVEIREQKAYWIDSRLLSLKQQYLLHYLPILDSYAVLDVNKAERYYFHNRQSAVRHMQLVYHYPMFDIGNLDAGRNYYARVRFGIDTDELPLPLKSSSLWHNDWDIQSDWFELSIDLPPS